MIRSRRPFRRKWILLEKTWAFWKTLTTFFEKTSFPRDFQLHLSRWLALFKGLTAAYETSKIKLIKKRKSRRARLNRSCSKRRYLDVLGRNTPSSEYTKDLHFQATKRHFPMGLENFTNELIENPQ